MSKKWKNKIHIGTSGWHYQEWKGQFYPKDMDSREFLSFYSKYFDTAEINNTFYKLPKEKDIEQWKKNRLNFFCSP